LTNDVERVIADLSADDGPHGLVSIAPRSVRAPVVCRCGWSSKPTTRERGSAIFLMHRQRVAVDAIARVEPTPDEPDPG
jgi:hypothetical protein